jgi:shikimate dehydrogenase
MSLSGATRVYGLIGDPVAHSLSPRLMNHAFARLGEDAVYVAWRVAPAGVAAAVRGLAALGVAGINVTYPHKAAVLPQVVARSDAVVALGAANVLVPAEGGWRAENTDAGGTALALSALLDWQAPARRIAILGAGGAARAAALGLLDEGAGRVDFLARDPIRAEQGLAGLRTALADGPIGVAALGSEAAAAALEAADLVVQATPVGLDDRAAAPLVLPAQAPRAAGFELVYGARPTAFARAWREAGRACLDGRDLLAAQAHLALRVWLDRAPALEDLRRAIATEEAP